jgi:hypothetical protein
MSDRERFWITKGRVKVEISDMTTPHLLNAYRWAGERMIEYKGLIEFAFSPFAPSEDTIAADDLDRCMEDVYKEEAILSSRMGDLREEIDKRGLSPLPLRKEFKPLPKVKAVHTVSGYGGRILELE